jgi:anti-anti-sigma regulatory factor
MTANSVGPEFDSEYVIHCLQEAASKLESGQAEVVLDFSPVQRLNPAAVTAMEKLAAQAGEKSVNVVFRGVNVDVYKVLKLMKLSSRFSFAN